MRIHSDRQRPPLIPALVAAAILIFLIATIARDGTPFAFDTAIMRALRRPDAPHWLSRAAVDITALGGGTVLTLLVVLVAGFLAIRGRWASAALTILATFSGGRAVDLVKYLAARPRPDIVPRLIEVSGQSFPSGHATNSTVVYLTLAALAAHATTDPRTRRYLFGVAILLTALIGTSRVYLGVHWPSDVLAGWSLGTLWALGWWWAAARLPTWTGSAFSLRILPRQGEVAPKASEGADASRP